MADLSPFAQDEIRAFWSNVQRGAPVRGIFMRAKRAVKEELMIEVKLETCPYCKTEQPESSFQVNGKRRKACAACRHKWSNAPGKKNVKPDPHPTATGRNGPSSPPLLTQIDKTATDVFTFRVNDVQTPRDVHTFTDKDGCRIFIVFKNRVFDSVVFPFKDPYTRHQWRVLAEIETHIENLEAYYERK